MMLYKLYTEDKKRKALCQLVGDLFPGYTMFKAIGAWQGKRERTIVFEILTDEPGAERRIELLCKQICGLNRQDAVLVRAMLFGSHTARTFGSAFAVLGTSTGFKEM